MYILLSIEVVNGKTAHSKQTLSEIKTSISSSNVPDRATVVQLLLLRLCCALFVHTYVRTSIQRLCSCGGGQRRAKIKRANRHVARKKMKSGATAVP